MISQQTCRHLEIVDKDLLMHAFAPPPQIKSISWYKFEHAFRSNIQVWLSDRFKYRRQIAQLVVHLTRNSGGLGFESRSGASLFLPPRYTRNKLIHNYLALSTK